jgi:hypothetical protein
MVMCSEPVMRGAGERLGGGELLADRHEAGHLGLGDLDLLAAPGGEPQVGDVEIVKSRVWYGRSWAILSSKATVAAGVGVGRRLPRAKSRFNERRLGRNPSRGLCDGCNAPRTKGLYLDGSAPNYRLWGLTPNWIEAMKRPLLLGCKAAATHRRERLRPRRHRIDYEEVDYSATAHAPRLLEVNPLGQVPTLGLPDGTVMHREPRDAPLP